jgi:hypothetical protein
VPQWNFAFDLKFGLYEWNDDGTQRRRLRDGAKVGCNTIQSVHAKGEGVAAAPARGAMLACLS